MGMKSITISAAWSWLMKQEKGRERLAGKQGVSFDALYRQYYPAIFAFLLLLTSCAGPANQGTVPVATAHPTSVPTPTATPTPVPPVPTLGPIPQHCPVSNSTPHMILQGLAPVIGASPVWATWPPGPSILKGQPDPNLNTYEPPYGWRSEEHTS